CVLIASVVEESRDQWRAYGRWLSRATSTNLESIYSTVYMKMISEQNVASTKGGDSRETKTAAAPECERRAIPAELNGVTMVDISPDELDCELHLGTCNRKLESMENFCREFLRRNRRPLVRTIQLILLCAYFAYFIYCVQYRFGDEGSWVLTGITAFILIKVAAKLLRHRKLSLSIKPTPCVKNAKRLGTIRKVTRYVLYAVALFGICIYIGVDVIRHDPSNLQALSGIAAMVFGCFIFSVRPSRVNWHPVFWGFMLQFVMAIITLRTRPGYQAFKWIGDLVESFVRLSDKGSNFVLGASFRATGPGFFFETAGVIVFFNACIFVLDYVGVLEFIILKIGRGLALCLETGPIESVVAAANIFIGLSEAPLLVRPYLPVITKSELHAVMTCGFASISGAFMAMFIKAG
ncbi:hypothetical protein EGW08_022260, partial [Elysia chlorotica]